MAFSVAGGLQQNSFVVCHPGWESFYTAGVVGGPNGGIGRLADDDLLRLKRDALTPRGARTLADFVANLQCLNA
jgi:hypothetical protein